MNFQVEVCEGNFFCKNSVERKKGIETSVEYQTTRATKNLFSLSGQLKYMNNRIDILSPGNACHKTKKLQRFMERFVRKYHVDAEIRVVTEPETLLAYRTWILPSVFVNGRPVARGYRPSEENILKNLKWEKHA